MDKTVEISQELGQQLMDYLATKPFNEVWQLIQKLQQASMPGGPDGGNDTNVAERNGSPAKPVAK